MSRKNEIEVEVKREMVRLLLTTSHFSFQKIDQVTEAADKLSTFITGDNQKPEACRPKECVVAAIQDLDSQGLLARALEKWLTRNERLRAVFRANHQKEPTALFGRSAWVGFRQDHHPSKR